MEFKLVTRHTRAGCSGKILKCPKCGAQHRTYDFAWSSLGCSSCNAMMSKYEWLVQTRDARTKTSGPSIHEALTVGCTIYVTSRVNDDWLSFYYLPDEGEVQVLRGSWNLGIGRDFMFLNRAFSELSKYESDPERWKVEVKS